MEEGNKKQSDMDSGKVSLSESNVDSCQDNVKDVGIYQNEDRPVIESKNKDYDDDVTRYICTEQSGDGPVMEPRNKDDNEGLANQTPTSVSVSYTSSDQSKDSFVALKTHNSSHMLSDQAMLEKNDLSGSEISVKIVPSAETFSDNQNESDSISLDSEILRDVPKRTETLSDKQRGSDAISLDVDKKQSYSDNQPQLSHKVCSDQESQSTCGKMPEKMVTISEQTHETSQNILDQGLLCAIEKDKILHKEQPKAYSENSKVASNTKSSDGHKLRAIQQSTDMSEVLCEKQSVTSLNDTERGVQNKTAESEEMNRTLMADSNKLVINMYLSWTDSNSCSKELSWTHEQCADCNLKLNEWQQHVLDSHSVNAVQKEKGKFVPDASDDESINVKSKLIDTDNGESIKIKTEPIDTDTLLNISVPCLVNLTSIAQKTRNVNKESQDEGAPSEANFEKIKPLKHSRKKNLKSIEQEVQRVNEGSENEGTTSIGNSEIDKLVKRPRKRRRLYSSAPKKARAKESITPTKKQKMDDTTKIELSKTKPLKKRSHSMNVKASDEPPNSKTQMPSDSLLPPSTNAILEKRQESDTADLKSPENPRSRSSRLRQKAPMDYTHSKPSYACTIEGCGRIFTGKTTRDKHEKNDHMGLKYACLFEGCTEKFRTKNGRGVHTRMKHQKVFDCPQCEMVFTSYKDRGFHMRTHASFTCDFDNCGKIYCSKKELSRHQKTHSGIKNIQCKVCSKAFCHTKQLYRHMISHQPKNIPCDLCDKMFRCRNSLDSHRIRHDKAKMMLACQFCGKNLCGKASLQNHERLHTGEKPFKCKYCDEWFISFSAKQSHEQDHNGIVYICPICGHKTKSQVNLKEHEKIHTGVKPKQCKECGEHFKGANALWVHTKIKHRGKEHICKICNKAFSLPDSLRRHTVVHTKEKNYQCEICRKWYSSSAARRAHKRQVHLGIKQTGHQGKAKRLKEEAKRLAEMKAQMEKNSGQPKLDAGPSGSQGQWPSRSTKEEVVNVPFSGQVPLAFQEQAPPLPNRDQVRPDFYSMVDSLIQFSKDN